MNDKPEVFSFISNQKLSWVLMISSTLFWTSGFIYPSEHNIHPYESNMSRSMVGIIINYLLMRYYNGNIDIRDNKETLYLYIRIITNSLNGIFVALLMFYLPMTVIHTVACTSTVITATIQYLFYGVYLSRKSLILVFISFFGVFFQANGNYIYNTLFGDGIMHRQSKFNNYIDITFLQSFMIVSLYLGFVILWSYGIVIIKKIKLAHYQINLYNNMLLAVLTGALYCYVPQQGKCSLSSFILTVILSGLPITLGQLCFVLSLVFSKSVGIIMILNTSNILFAYLYSIFRYKQKIDPFSFAGAIVTVACIVMIISQKYK